jgi:transcription elongation factor Elf1
MIRYVCHRCHQDTMTPQEIRDTYGAGLQLCRACTDDFECWLSRPVDTYNVQTFDHLRPLPR